MNSKPLTIALIGCGRISLKHIEALKQVTDKIQIIGVCDIDNIKLKQAMENANCPGYQDFLLMIKELKPDIISIAVPNGLHPKMICEVAGSGVKNIICEKPLSIDYVSGRQAYEYCKNHDVRLFLIYQNRFNSPIIALKEALASGRLGRINMIAANVFWQRPQEYYNNSWHGTLEMDGGAFLTQASHYIDMVSYLMNSASISVYAKLSTLARKIETEDTGSVIIEFDNGTIANVNMTILTYPRNIEGSVTILCDKATIKIGGIAMNEVLVWEVEDKELSNPQISKVQLDFNETSIYGNGHLNNYLDIYNAIITSQSANIEGETILTTQKILSGIYQSNTLKMPVKI